MGRAPCCDKASVKKGPWSPEEDAKLREYIEKHGTGGNWIALPQKVGLKRCGKSCRLRWLNYLRPNIKHGEFSDDEDRIICTLFANIGSRWSIIASHLPGRTDNDIKNYWNTKLKKKLLAMAPYNPYPKSRPHQVTTFPFPYNNSFLQNPSIPSVYSSSLQSQISSPYEWGNSSFLTTPIRACSGAYGPISPNFTTSHARGPDGSVGPFHGNCYQVNRVDKSNLLILGGEPSCSSSDGSCISNPVGRGKEMDGQDYKFPGGDQDLCFQGLFINGADENQKFLIGTATNGSSNGCLGENPLDYSIEEIKQLISTNNMCNSLGFLVDEIKTEGKVLDW